MEFWSRLHRPQERGKEPVLMYGQPLKREPEDDHPSDKKSRDVSERIVSLSDQFNAMLLELDKGQEPPDG